MLGTEGLLRLDKEGLLSGLAEWASSQAGQRGLPLGLGKRDLLPGSSQSSSQTRNREHPVGHSREGLVLGDLLSGSVLVSLLGFSREGLLSGSEKRASSQARRTVPPLYLDTEGLSSGSTQRASSRARQSGPPL